MNATLIAWAIHALFRNEGIDWITVAEVLSLTARVVLLARLTAPSTRRTHAVAPQNEIELSGSCARSLSGCHNAARQLLRRTPLRITPAKRSEYSSPRPMIARSKLATPPRSSR